MENAEIQNEIKTLKNILHRCKNCFIILTTELNVINLNKKFPDIFESFKKDEIILYIKKKEEFTHEIMSHVLYQVDNKFKKIKCKICDNEIGFCIKVNAINYGHPYVGVLLVDKLFSEEITQATKNEYSEEFDVKSQFLLENTKLFKNLKMVDKIVTEYYNNFYKKEYKECVEQFEKMQIKSEYLTKSINKLVKE